jgi:HSP20 family molecular chaperone IbpA
MAKTQTSEAFPTGAHDLPHPPGADDGLAAQQVRVNLYETTDALVAVAAMPGVMPEDIEITVDDGVLSLEADLRTEAPKSYVLHEWDYGRYQRVLQLPLGFRGPVTASYGNGQLAVRILRTGERPATVVLQPESPLRHEPAAD